MPSIARIPLGLSADDVEALTIEGISTIEDFLLADVAALRLPGLSESRRQELIICGYIPIDIHYCAQIGSDCQSAQVLGQLFKYVHRNIAPPSRNASDILLGPALQDTVPTGCAVIDELLDGGMAPGHILELVGVPGCAKTQVCISASVVASAILKAKVIYIDACQTFSGRRFEDFHRGFASRVEVDEVEEALRRVLLVRSTAVYEVLGFLDAVYTSHSGTKDTIPTLLIVDSVPALISQHLGGKTHGHGQALMSALETKLKKIALDINAAVLTINNLVGSSSNEEKDGVPVAVKPSLGLSWLRVPSTRIQITQTGDSGALAVTTAKNSGETSQILGFSVTRTGFESIAF